MGTWQGRKSQPAYSGQTSPLPDFRADTENRSTGLGTGVGPLRTVVSAREASPEAAPGAVLWGSRWSRKQEEGTEPCTQMSEDPKKVLDWQLLSLQVFMGSAAAWVGR